MISVEVCTATGESIYSTVYARWIVDTLFVQRLSPDLGFIDCSGPNFSIYCPRSLHQKPLRRQTSKFTAQGDLGQMNMVSGAQARDGWEAYEIVEVRASSVALSAGISMSMQVTTGDPDLRSFLTTRPNVPSGTRYSIDVLVPFNDLFEFADIRRTPEAWLNVATQLKSNFGFDLAPFEGSEHA